MANWTTILPSPLNCFMQRAEAFAGRSKIPITNLACTISIPVAVATWKPVVFSCLMALTTGLINSFMGGLHGPTHTPARRMFCALVRIFEGRLRITRETGHKLVEEDLKRGTPSADKVRVRWLGVEKKCPVDMSGFRASPSQTSQLQQCVCAALLQTPPMIYSIRYKRVKIIYPQ